MGSLVHLFEILREEDQAAVKVAIADVPVTFPSRYNNPRDQAQAQFSKEISRIRTREQKSRCSPEERTDDPVRF